MDIEIIIAKVLGPILVLLGLWLFIVPELLEKAIADLKERTGFPFLYGLINLLVGFFIIAVYNVWEWNIFLAVTLLGWVLILRGIFLWFKPEKFLKSRAIGTVYHKIFKFIVLVWGVILIWAAYFG